MSDVSSHWKVRTTLEYTIPIGSHVDEIGKAQAMMSQEMQRQGVSGDVFLETDDDNIILAAIVEERRYPDRPKFQVTRGVMPDRIGESDGVRRDPTPTGFVDTNSSS